MSMFATVSHRKIRGWAHLRKVEQHNDRDIDTPAREEGRPMPIEQLAGDGDVVDRTQALLTAKGVPHKLRKNTVLAYEDVFGASPGYWEQRYPQGWKNASAEELERDPLAVALMAHVKRKYGDKLVSVRLHLDEKTPHWHVVSIPLVTAMHKQRGRRRKDGVIPPPIEKTTLYASHPDERGGSGRRLEVEHDEWAAATAHLGLVRGKRGSDLTEEERRDRRLRDGQASRQGEERARQRAKETAHAAAAGQVLEVAGEEFVRIVDEGKVEAARLVVEAAAAAKAAREQGDRDAVRVKVAASAEAQRLVDAARRTSEQEASRIKADARSEAATIRVRAEDDAARTRANAGAEVDRRVADAVAERETAVGDREAAVTKSEGLMARDRRDIDVRLAVVKTGAQTNRDRAAALDARDAALDARDAALDARDLESATLAERLLGLIAELEPALSVVRAIYDRVRHMPAAMRRAIDPAGEVSGVVAKASRLLDVARELAATRPPIVRPVAPAVEEGLSVVEQSLARGDGRGGR